jgi:hypothetical protein
MYKRSRKESVELWGKYFEKSSKSPDFALTCGLSVQEVGILPAKKVRTRSEQPIELPDMDGYLAT